MCNGIHLHFYLYRSKSVHAFGVQMFNTLTHVFDINALYGFRYFKMLHLLPNICALKILPNASSSMKRLIISDWEPFCISSWAFFLLFHKRKRHLSGPRGFTSEFVFGNDPADHSPRLKAFTSSVYIRSYRRENKG